MQERSYQNKFNSSLISTCNCKIKWAVPEDLRAIYVVFHTFYFLAFSDLVTFKAELDHILITSFVVLWI